MVEFQSDAQQACYERILPWLKALPFEVTLDPHSSAPLVYVSAGSACTVVEVLPWQDDAAIVARAYVVTEVDLVPGLMQYLLAENDRLLFGSFGLDADGDIFLQHAIVGSGCDRQELETTVQAVLSLADDYDDAIVARWGGRRSVDRARPAGSGSS